MERQFVVVSGLPGSGKSTLAQRLAPALSLPLLDKDTILESLFESKGVGGVAWRRALSRESDRILQAEATALHGAILVSHWRLPGMPPSSGTPTEWLSALSCQVVNVHCECPVDVATQRYLRRIRHHGHLDGGRSYAETLRSLQEIAALGRPDFAPRIVPCVPVDTSQAPALEPVLNEILRAFSQAY